MAATTWDPNAKAAGITLSGSNLVATAASGTNPGVFATRALTGPSYWQVTVMTLASTMGIGIASRAWNDANSTLPGNDANNNSLGYLNNGTVRLNNVTLATIQTFTGGSVVEVAVNPQARLAWFRVDGGNWNNDVIGNQNPVGNVGGIDFSSMAFDTLLPVFGASTTTGAGTANFTGSFAHTAPTGYISVDTSSALGHAAELTSSTPPHDGPARQDPVTVNAQKTGFGTGAGGWYGISKNTPSTAVKQWSPAATATHVSGTITANGSPVSTKVRAYDHNTGEFLGETLSSAGDGSFSIPALGRASVVVVAMDAPNYNAMVFDTVTPL